MKHGEVWWASLPAPSGSGPGFRRPVVVVQSDPFNRSRISTVIIAVMTSNQALAAAPGNVRIGRRESGLRRASVVNVSQIFTVDKTLLTSRICALPTATMHAVEAGVRKALGL